MVYGPGLRSGSCCTSRRRPQLLSGWRRFWSITCVVRSQLRSSDVLACQQGVPGDVQENRSTWASALKTRKGKKKGKNHCFWEKIPRRGTGVRERRQAWDNKGYSAWDTGNDWAGHEAWRRITPQARWVWDTSSTASVASEAGCQHLSVLALGGQDHMHEQSVWPISLYFGTKVWEGRHDMARASFGSSHAGRCFATTGRGRDHGPLDRRSKWLPRLGKLSGLALLSLMGHFHFLALMTFDSPLFFYICALGGWSRCFSRFDLSGIGLVERRMFMFLLYSGIPPCFFPWCAFIRIMFVGFISRAMVIERFTACECSRHLEPLPLSVT